MRPPSRLVPRHNFAPSKLGQQPGPLATIIASRHHATGSLWHPALDRAPSIFDVIGGKPIGIDNLAGAMVDHLMP